MPSQVRVNIRSVANTKKMRQEKRNGRDVIVVPSATLPDNVVMNGIMYPAEEIAKGYQTLNRSPAPLGHPTINGQFVSASDPEGINIGYIGAWNENARQESGRVLLDKVIDVEVANRSEGGKRVLAALNEGKPIHTSTGLLCSVSVVENAEGYDRVASEMYFDHDAILLDEEGAATPAQGVGMLVNGQQIEVVNSSLEDVADQEIDWAGTRLVEALERKRFATLWEQVKTAILEAISPEREPVENRKDDAMSAELQKQLGDLSATVNALADTVGKLATGQADAISAAVAAAVKPLVDAQTATNAAAAEAAKAEKEALVEKVVKANLLTDVVAKELTINALKELVAKIPAGTAAPLNGAFALNGAKDDWADYDLNKLMEAK